MKLKQHIKEDFNGNVTAFAKSINERRQQVERWIKLDCIWHDGRVYAPKTK
jgi:hypothetical protein